VAEPTWAMVSDFANRLEAAEKRSATEHRVWLNLIALLPFGVTVEKTVNIPLQRTAPRHEVDLWPPAVVQDRSRFLDTRNT
jgi:hypothetical protein